MTPEEQVFNFKCSSEQVFDEQPRPPGTPDGVLLRARASLARRALDGALDEWVMDFGPVLEAVGAAKLRTMDRVQQLEHALRVAEEERRADVEKLLDARRHAEQHFANHQRSEQALANARAFGELAHKNYEAADAARRAAEVERDALRQQVADVMGDLAELSAEAHEIVNMDANTGWSEVVAAALAEGKKVRAACQRLEEERDQVARDFAALGDSRERALLERDQALRELDEARAAAIRGENIAKLAKWPEGSRAVLCRVIGCEDPGPETSTISLALRAAAAFAAWRERAAQELDALSRSVSTAERPA